MSIPMDRESLLKFARYVFYIGLICGLVYILIPMDPLPLRPSVVQNVLQQLTILIVVALFLERALEVYKLSYFSLEKERLAADVDTCQTALQSLIAETEGLLNSDGVQATRLRLLNAEDRLRVYVNGMRQSLLLAAIVFGLLIGLVGVRSLEGAFDFPPPISTVEIFRFYLFRVLDVILTAGLIAGGSEGIHTIIKKLSNFFPDIPQKIIGFVQAIRQDPA